ncbi:MAG: acyl-CoA dehydrogenase family protein, partial [Anaerolineales bacterium]|nr:acyl-CoA dehydrogenase family protein [Anaerolineales bacterium]
RIAELRLQKLRAGPDEDDIAIAKANGRAARAAAAHGFIAALPAGYDSLLGPRDGGAAIAARAYDRLKVALAAVALGAAETALQLGVSFAVERKQFGIAIAHKQAMQNYIADVHADIEALRHTLYYAAWLVDTGRDFSHAAALAKYLGARVAKDAANKMLQVHGGYGFSDEYTISRVYRDVRALRILGGTDEVQRVQIAGEVLRQAGVQIGM